MSIFKLAWRNIMSNPLNLALNLILFSLGIALISFLFQMNGQIKEKFDNNLAGIDMVVGAKGSPLQMILCNMYHIDNPTGNISIGEAKAFLNPKHPLIKRAVPLSLGDSHQGFRIVGTNDSMFELYNAEIAEGRNIEETLEVVIGKSVADKTGMKIGDGFYSSHGFIQDEDMTHDNAELKVVGIIKRSGTVMDNLIICNPQTVWAVHEHEESHETPQDTIQKAFSLLDYPEKEITSILIQFKNRTNFQALNMPRNINENTDMQAASPAIEINRLYDMVGVGSRALQMLAILITIVSAISIFISLFSSLKSRKYELALMRVMGAGPGKLFILIILEGLILAIISFILGILVSHLAMFFMSEQLSEAYKYEFSAWRMTGKEGPLFLMSLILGFVASVIPAYRAYRTDIHQTLSKI